MNGQAMFVAPKTCAVTTRGVLIALAAFSAGHMLLVDRARGDLQIAGYEDRLHDRFYVGGDKDFIGAGYNWSGVGRMADPAGGSTNWKFATMISDNYFITANHFRPNRGDDGGGALPKVRFYRTDDPNGEFWESTIALSGSNYTGVTVGATDLWVGKLASTPPEWVMRYPLAKRHEATNYLSYTDNDLFVFGQDSPRGLASGRVGRNEIESVNSDGDFQWSYDLTGGFGRDEAETVSGDSGGPSFFTLGSLPVLAGIHTRTNFDTGISANLEQIMQAVGEPISVSTGLLGDVNGSFRVNTTDFGIFAANFGKADASRLYQGDVNGDGHVAMGDFSAITGAFGKSLFAPADFDRDGDVDSTDLSWIGKNWQISSSVPFGKGDATGNAFVDFADLQVFDQNQNRGYFGAVPAPLSPITADLDGNGIVNEIDNNIVLANLNRRVPAGTLGDLNLNGVVDYADLSVVVSAVGDSFGDISGDHVVGPDDFVILANNWNQFLKGGRAVGDLNGDFTVNSTDARILFDWWGVQGMTLSGAAVPEPSALFLAVLAGMGLVGRIRRH